MTVVILLVLLLIGGVLGFLLPRQSLFVRISTRLVTPMVYLLLLVLGFHLGEKQEIVAKLPTLGWSALLLTLGAVIMCIVVGALTQPFFDKYRTHSKGAMKEPDIQDRMETSSVEPAKKKSSKVGPILSTLSFFFTFIAGLVVAVCFSLPALLTHPSLSEWVLYPFLFLVGVSIGSDRDALQGVKSLSFVHLLLPLVTVVATLLGAGLASFFLPNLNLLEAQAVASGFGYYSLSSVLISSQYSEVLGAIALLANIMRELIAILLAPLIAYLGRGANAPIMVGGATSMDTSLPFIVSATSTEHTVLSLYHGIVLTVLVPWSVSLMLSWMM